MPDGNVTQRGVQRTPVRRYPGRAPVPRGRSPFRQVRPRRFPRFFLPTVYFGIPRQRCYYIDQFGRCCDRFGRCEYIGDRYNPIAAMDFDGWYGVPGGWDMMPDTDNMQSYDDMTDYDSDMDY